jgi:hypothetical protein
MALIPHSTVYEVSGLNAADKTAIFNFLQGAVYSWCKNKPQEWFALRDLMGGTNNNWDETPLAILYDRQKKQIGKSHEEAYAQAAIDGGRILKEVLHQDARKFEAPDPSGEPARQYRWFP